MSYKLFLDDIQTMGIKYLNAMETDFVALGNFSDFKNYSSRGVLSFISLHNGLILFQSSIRIHYSNCLNHNSFCVWNECKKKLKIFGFRRVHLFGINICLFFYSISFTWGSCTSFKRSKMVFKIKAIQLWMAFKYSNILLSLHWEKVYTKLIGHKHWM